jgi:hypothetical protein
MIGQPGPFQESLVAPAQPKDGQLHMVRTLLTTGAPLVTAVAPVDDAFCQALLVFGVVATAASVGLAVWLALTTVLAKEQARQRQRMRDLWSPTPIVTIADSDLLEIPGVVTDSADHGGLYGDLGDTSPAAPLFRMDDVPEPDFFDGDTEVEAGPHRADIAVSLRG